MIVAGPEGFVKNQYRKFNMKREEFDGDDFAMMKAMIRTQVCADAGGSGKCASVGGPPPRWGRCLRAANAKGVRAPRVEEMSRAAHSETAAGLTPSVALRATAPPSRGSNDGGVDFSKERDGDHA